MAGVTAYSLFLTYPIPYSSKDDERSEDGPWPPGDIGGLVDAHGVTGVMVCHVHCAVRSDAVDLAGAPRSVALQLEAVEVDAQAAHPLSPRSGLCGGTGSLGDLDVLRHGGGGLLLASTGVERDGEAQQHYYQQQDEHDALEQVLELVIHNFGILDV